MMADSSNNNGAPSSTMRRRQGQPASATDNMAFTAQEDEIMAENKRRLQRQAQLDAEQVAAAKRSFFWSILIVGVVAALFFCLKVYGFLDEPPIRQAAAKSPKWSTR